MTTDDGDATSPSTWRGTISDLRAITDPVDRITAANAFIAMCRRQADKAAERGGVDSICFTEIVEWQIAKARAIRGDAAGEVSDVSL